MSAIEQLRTRLADPEAEISLREVAAALLELAPLPGPPPPLNRVSFDTGTGESEDARYLVEWHGRAVWLYDEDDADMDPGRSAWCSPQDARMFAGGDLEILGEISCLRDAYELIRKHRGKA